MRATILTIGDEILIGQITDTNATYMAAALSEEGITVVEHLSVADSRIGIMGGLDRALQQSDLVLMTGGLGPTKDDITKLVLADYFGAELRLHSPTWNRLQKIFSRYGRKATDVHKQQCRLPTGAKVMTNEHGTAPGLWLEKDDQVVISMPGVPYEMVYLMDNEVMRRLKRREMDADLLRSVTILTAGEGESTIADRLEELEESLPDHMGLAYLPSLGTVRLRISARGDDEQALQRDLDAFRTAFEQELGSLIYGYGKDDLASVIATTLQERKLTLATAESCTGGYLSSLITALPGSSAHYVGGVVAYSNPLKVSLLGVANDTLEEFGAVSEETVTQMAEGARERLGADYALSTSGIAGPSGGTPQKPVGTIWIALATPERTITKLLRSGKDRQRNIEYTALQALNMLRLEIGAKGTPPPLAAAPLEAIEKDKPKRKSRSAAKPKPETGTEQEETTPAVSAPAAKKSRRKTRGAAKPKTEKKEEKTSPAAPSPPEEKPKGKTRGSTRAKAEKKTAETAAAPTEEKPKRTSRRKKTAASASGKEPEVVQETESVEKQTAKPKRSSRGPRKSKTKATTESPTVVEAAAPAKPKRTSMKKAAESQEEHPTSESETGSKKPAKPKRTPRRKK